MSFPVLFRWNLWELVNFRKFHEYIYTTLQLELCDYTCTKYFTLLQVKQSLLTIELYNW